MDTKEITEKIPATPDEAQAKTPLEREPLDQAVAEIQTFNEQSGEQSGAPKAAQLVEDEEEMPDSKNDKVYVRPVEAGTEVETGHEMIIRHTHNRLKIWLIAVGAGIVLLGSALAYLLLTQQPQQSSTPSNQAQVILRQGALLTLAEGSVEYEKSGSWQTAPANLTLKEGDHVRTGNASRAIIALDDGSAVRLDQNSEITLVKLETKSVVVSNQKGSVYARVTASATRTFDVLVNTQAYRALGTAFKTVNDGAVEGVSVYHSKVEVKNKATVEEGKNYFVKTADTAKLNVVSDIDLTALKSDTFLLWNKTEDAKETEFADKLGVLVDIDKPVAATPVTTPVPPAPKATTPTAGISASGAAVASGIKINWTTTGIDTKSGFKVVYSKSTTTPTYGKDSAKFVSGSTTNLILEFKDGKTWHVRVCLYGSDGKCTYYSNTVSVTAPYVAPEKVTLGSTTATLTEATLSWAIAGTAPYGYKVTWNTSGSPTYPTSGSNAGAAFVSGTSTNLNERISEPGTYKVRVCKYTSGTEEATCVDYSNEITFVKS